MIGKIKITDFETAKKIIVSPYSGFNVLVSAIDPMDEDNLNALKCKLNLYPNPPIFISRFYLDFDENDPSRGEVDKLGPSKYDAETFIVQFQKLIDDKKVFNVLIHCFAGVSRSTALGFLLLKMMGNSHEEAWEKLMEIRPYAIPNLRFLKHCSDYLGEDIDTFVRHKNARLEMVGWSDIYN